jgi:ABC-type glutathione transport system ATPase component
MTSPLLEVEGVRVGRAQRSSTTTIVEDARLTVGDAETVALLGGTGSGKTLTARAIMGVLPPGIVQLGGSIRFEGVELTQLPPESRRRLRGTGIAYVPQNAKAALHPLRRIGAQMRTLRRDLGLDRGDEAARIEALESVRIRDPERVLRAYPHELSGGMAQRVTIALALLGRPRLLIADEPTTGLDATVQAQVMQLIESRARDTGASTLLVTHDLGVVAQHCDRAIIIEHGRVTEERTIEDLFADPQSTYGRLLVEAAHREAQSMAEATA